MKKPERSQNRKLVVHRESLVQLTTHQLAYIRGGDSYQDTCGCASNANPSCVAVALATVAGRGD
jgi:hypothetical protein